MSHLLGAPYLLQNHIARPKLTRALANTSLFLWPQQDGKAYLGPLNLDKSHIMSSSMALDSGLWTLDPGLGNGICLGVPNLCLMWCLPSSLIRLQFVLPLIERLIYPKNIRLK